MNQQKKELINKYLLCSGIASAIAFIVFWIKGFFSNNIGVNIQILSDGFFVSGILMTLIAGMLYVANEGAFIGIGFVLRNIVLALIPMGRAKQERYADYRERKLSEKKVSVEPCFLVVGLIFLAVAVAFAIAWDYYFYNNPV